MIIDSKGKPLPTDVLLIDTASVSGLHHTIKNLKRRQDQPQYLADRSMPGDAGKVSEEKSGLLKDNSVFTPHNKNYIKELTLTTIFLQQISR